MYIHSMDSKLHDLFGSVASMPFAISFANVGRGGLTMSINGAYTRVWDFFHADGPFALEQTSPQTIVAPVK